MAKNPTRNQSNKQESDIQRKEAETSPESTSLTSSSATAAETGRLSVEEELAQIEEQAAPDKDPNEGKEKIAVKTLGSYLVHDPTTGDTVEADGEKTEVTKSAYIMAQIKSGRLVEA